MGRSLAMFASHDIVPAAAIHARQAGVVSLLGNGSYLGSLTTTICAPGVALPTPAKYLPYTTVYTTEFIQICPSTPTPGSSCPGPNCPPSPPAKVVCPGPACPSGSSNTTTPPHITANSGSSGHVHMVAILLGATVGLAAFCL